MTALATRVFRVWRALLTESALMALGMGSAVGLWWQQGPCLAAAGCLTLAGLGAGVGIAARGRSGELRLRFECPRLSALGLALPSQEAPWAVLALAESALEALDTAQRRYHGFFPGAQAELFKAATRAVAAHQRVAQARGEPGLEARAAQELLELSKLLREIRKRLLESILLTQPECSPLPALQALEERCGALAQAVAESHDPQLPSVGGHP